MPPVLALTDDASTASFSVQDAKQKQSQVPRRAMQRRHSVDFACSHKIVEFDKADVEDKEEIWYSRDEYDIIKARNRLLVKMKKTGNFEETDEHSFRGLEHKLKEGFSQRRSNKFNALNVVLEEQDRQYSRGLINAENIANKYERVAIDARENAFFLGLRDAEESYSKKNSTTPEAVVDGDDGDDLSTVSDLDTICSEDTQQRRLSVRLRLPSMFSGRSRKKINKAQPITTPNMPQSMRHKATRRASM